LLGDPAQLGPEFFLAAHVAERAFGADAFPLVLFSGTHAGVPKAEVDLHEEVECFFTEELGEGGAVRVDVAAGFDADSIQFALEDAADAVDFSGGQVAHEGHDSGSVACDAELSVGFVAVGGDFGDSGVGGHAGRDGDFGALKDLSAELADCFVRAHVVVGAVPGDVEVGFIHACALEAGVILGQHFSDLLRLLGVLFEIQGQADELRA
ncbi:MAG: hypothetical protein Q9193_003185, partial [Seirophora villosa]